jgi:hypothetical protein
MRYSSKRITHSLQKESKKYVKIKDAHLSYQETYIIWGKRCASFDY